MGHRLCGFRSPYKIPAHRQSSIQIFNPCVQVLHEGDLYNVDMDHVFRIPLSLHRADHHATAWQGALILVPETHVLNDLLFRRGSTRINAAFALTHEQSMGSHLLVGITGEAHLGQPRPSARRSITVKRTVQVYTRTDDE